MNVECCWSDVFGTRPLLSIKHYTFAVDYPCLQELWYIKSDAEEEDRDEVEADPLASRAGLGEVSVGVGVADSAVPASFYLFC